MDKHTLDKLPEYEVYAIRYATVDRSRSDNFISNDLHDINMPMDYFIWVIKGDSTTYIVDTGFNQKAALERKRRFLRCPIESLKHLGIDKEDKLDVIITHMHYDHAGNIDLLPNSRFHIQEREMSFATGKWMLQHIFREPYSAKDVTEVVKSLYQDRVVFHNGDVQLKPGIELMLIGGHTKGLQSVRVHTKRGWLTLTSDASHYYENILNISPFPIVFNVGEMVSGYDKIMATIESKSNLIPGHDPLVYKYFPHIGPETNGIVGLHLDPIKEIK